MELMTDKQKMFDHVVVALAKQGRQAAHGLTCKYRMADGRKCAAGHLIPDDRYEPAMEGIAISGLIAPIQSYQNKFTPLTEWDKEGLSAFLVAVQSAHDEAKVDANKAFIEPWYVGDTGYDDGIASKLGRVAIMHRLDNTKLLEAFPQK